MENTTRRRLLAAGLAGTASSVVIRGLASAGSTPPTPPKQPTGSDAELLAGVQAIELAAGDLYQASIDAGVPDESSVVAAIRENHRGSANLISALIGGAAPQAPDDALVAARLGEFDTDNLAAVAAAGYDLESEIVATHLAVLGDLEGTNAALTIASILIVESRQAAVLADVLGQGDDLDALLVNDAEALELTGDATS